jgi:hypothetical protein
MSEPVFCGRCKHYRWSYDQEVCRPLPPVEMNYYGWHKKLYRPRDQNEHNNCIWYEPNCASGCGCGGIAGEVSDDAARVVG